MIIAAECISCFAAMELQNQLINHGMSETHLSCAVVLVVNEISYQEERALGIFMSDIQGDLADRKISKLTIR